MINAYFFTNSKEKLCGFRVYDHGESHVCAAVSALAINTVNSIEALTKEEMDFQYNDDGGYMELLLPVTKSGGFNHDADLLLNSLLIGLSSIKAEHEFDLAVTVMPLSKY